MKNKTKLCKNSFVLIQRCIDEYLVKLGNLAWEVSEFGGDKKLIKKLGSEKNKLEKAREELSKLI